jgi:hypothetical protein
MLRLSALRVPFLVLVFSYLLLGESAPFDLVGPRLQVKVTRAGKTLPISQVPNLKAGDRLWIYPDLPEDQSVRYLLIAAFLRGPTNPPPDNWFTKAETWRKDVREEGIYVTVPSEAQQVLLFLAPQTGGDFSTLRSAVQGKPGAFVRASQDLNQAGLDRSRLDKYLAGVRQTSDTNHDALHQRSQMLARSLNMKLDEQCFDKPTEQQTPCLMKNTDQLVLDDGHSQSMVAALTSGPNSDLIGQISTTRLAGGGTYSPYVGAIVDLARVMENFHTAEYQYIPALAVPTGDQLNLRLNNPPSFHKPKSVLVIGLPAVEAPQLPPMRTVDKEKVSCVQDPNVVLAVEGAPLVFSTALGHDFALHLRSRSGKDVQVPVVADPARGGFILQGDAPSPDTLPPANDAVIRGYWGFETFEGPTYKLRSSEPTQWTVPASDRTALVVGRESSLHFEGGAIPCVEQVTVRNQHGEELHSTWKAVKPDQIETKVELQTAGAGPLKLLVKQYGVTKADELPLQAYAEPGDLQQFVINAGDQQGSLKGTRLDQVASLDMAGIHFVPSGLTRAEGKDVLLLKAETSTASVLAADQKTTAQVTLKDGRVLPLETTVQPPRPRVSLVSKVIEPGPQAREGRIRLGNQDDLPQDAKLQFFLKSETPPAFPRNSTVEVATEDESARVVLSMAEGSLNLQDAQTVLAVLDPLKSFGPATFGPLRFRVVDANGWKSDWQALATLVRLPALKEIRCPESADQQCELSGTNMFLIDSVAADSEFTRNVSVPLGFGNSTLTVPHTAESLLYMKLRDDPRSVNTISVPILREQKQDRDR